MSKLEKTNKKKITKYKKKSRNRRHSHSSEILIRSLKAINNS